MAETRSEIALLEWGSGVGTAGVRIVARSSDKRLLDLVRDHLIRELTHEPAEAANEAGELRLIAPSPKDSGE